MSAKKKPLYRKQTVANLREGDWVRDRRLRGQADEPGTVADVQVYDMRTLVRFTDGHEGIMLNEELVFLYLPAGD